MENKRTQKGRCLHSRDSAQQKVLGTEVGVKSLWLLLLLWLSTAAPPLLWLPSPSTLLFWLSMHSSCLAGSRAGF